MKLSPKGANSELLGDKERHLRRAQNAWTLESMNSVETPRGSLQLTVRD